jgi:hypothetical protein
VDVADEPAPIEAALGPSPRTIKSARSSFVWVWAIVVVAALVCLDASEPIAFRAAMVGAALVMAAACWAAYRSLRSQPARMARLTKDALEIWDLDQLECTVRLEEVATVRLGDVGFTYLRGTASLLAADGSVLAEMPLDARVSDDHGRAQRALMGELLRRLTPEAVGSQPSLAPSRGAFIALGATLAVMGALFLWLTVGEVRQAIDVDRAGGDWRPSAALSLFLVALAASFMGLAVYVTLGWRKVVANGQARRKLALDSLCSSPPAPIGQFEEGRWYAYAGQKANPDFSRRVRRWLGKTSVVLALFLGVIGALLGARDTGEPPWTRALQMGLAGFATPWLVVVVSLPIQRQLDLRLRVIGNDMEIHLGSRVVIVDPVPVKKLRAQGEDLGGHRWKDRVDIDLRYLVPEEPDERPG